MKKLVPIILLMLTIVSCETKNRDNETTVPTTDNTKDFTGSWQSEKNENLIFEIAKINDDTYSLSWKGWMDPAKSDGGFSVPGEMHTGGHETLIFNGDHLDMQGIAKVAYVNENTLYIDAGAERGKCKRK